MTVSGPTEKPCRIEHALGHSEVCTEARCPFWQVGSAVLEGGCAFEQLDLAGRSELAGWLHELRLELEAAGPRRGTGELRHLFYERLNAGKSD